MTCSIRPRFSKKRHIGQTAREANTIQTVYHLEDKQSMFRGKSGELAAQSGKRMKYVCCLLTNKMFGDGPPQNDSDDEELLNDPFADDVTGEPLWGMDSGEGALPWEQLPEEEAEELEEKSEAPMCEHDDDRQVITKQSGAGVKIAGTGSNVTQTVTKVVCPTCGGEWDTWDGSNKSTGQDLFRF